MYISGKHFIYGGISSLDYGLSFLHIEEEPIKSVCGNTTLRTTYSARNNKNYLYDKDRSDGSAFSVEILSEKPISRADFNKIEKWLFSRAGYTRLEIHPIEDEDIYEYGNGAQRQYVMCLFINPSVIEYSGGVYGWRCTMACDSGYARIDVPELTITPTSDPYSAVVVVNSDMEGYIYPKITILSGATAGNISITNTSDSATRVCSFSNVPANTEIVMYGDISYMDESKYAYFSSKNFVRLMDGSNSITISGSVASLKLMWSEARFMR